MATNSVKLTVNGLKHELQVDEKETLMDVLRDRLSLTGTKNACAYGACGACTVVMNGEAVKSCLQKPDKYNGKEVLTIEGISDGHNLHPIQEAFIEAGAIQCGFCTPGFVMSLYALFNNNLNATDDEIKEVLEKHVCRCTGYEFIWDAAKLAQKMLREP
ncbi:MAG: (2Fe-2S)-binding protein [Dethiobacteria bacterium]|nr:(2Fe-2S)-binding protein [Dethiobacteria bacterium]